MTSSLYQRRQWGAASNWSDTGSFEESIRVVRSNLSVALTDIDRPRVIVTSAIPGEGKTTTCAHLAIAFAAAGVRTVLVDLDLRHPNAHRLVGGHNEFGSADVLLGNKSLDAVMQYVTILGYPGRNKPGLYLLSTGAEISNPTELLGSGRTARLLDGLAKQADLVLVDTPPVLPVADTLVIGRIASGAIMVTEVRSTPITSVQKAKDLLVQNQTRILGVVLNKLQPRDAAVHYGYGYYASQSASTDKPTTGSSGNGHASRARSPGDFDP